MTDYSYGARSIVTRGIVTTTTYTPFHHPEKRTGKCPVCDKRRTRSRNFTATMSPFNTDPETGQPRTRQQIVAHLREQGAAWVPDFTCQTHELEG